MNKLVLVGLLVINSSAFSFGYSDNSQSNYQQDMLREQQQQNRIMQQQANDQANAQNESMYQQRMQNEIYARSRSYVPIQ